MVVRCPLSVVRSGSVPPRGWEGEPRLRGGQSRTADPGQGRTTTDNGPRTNGLSFRSTHLEEPGGGAAGPVAGARAWSSAARADALAGGPVTFRPAGRAFAAEPTGR